MYMTSGAAPPSLTHARTHALTHTFSLTQPDKPQAVSPLIDGRRANCNLAAFGAARRERGDMPCIICNLIHVYLCYTAQKIRHSEIYILKYTWCSLPATSAPRSASRRFVPCLAAPTLYPALDYSSVFPKCTVLEFSFVFH
jgi:hypothetical protein